MYRALVRCGRTRRSAVEWTPHPTELRIYVYDLPATVSYMRPVDDGWCVPSRRGVVRDMWELGFGV
jgi:hypothetical protein